MLKISYNKTLVYLFLFSAFLAGMVLGMMASSDKTGRTDNPVFTLLIFATGLSVGAFITRLQQQIKTRNNQQ